MLDHTGFVVTDLAKARRFYDAVAQALGLGTIDNGPDAFLLGPGALRTLVVRTGRRQGRSGPRRPRRSSS